MVSAFRPILVTMLVLSAPALAQTGSRGGAAGTPSVGGIGGTTAAPTRSFAAPLGPAPSAAPPIGTGSLGSRANLGSGVGGGSGGSGGSGVGLNVPAPTGGTISIIPQGLAGGAPSTPLGTGPLGDRANVGSSQAPTNFGLPGLGSSTVPSAGGGSTSSGVAAPGTGTSGGTSGTGAVGGTISGGTVSIIPNGLSGSVGAAPATGTPTQ